MRPIVNRFTPAKGFSHLLHLSLVAVLPLILLVIIRQGYFGLPLAIALVLLSKWRMFAVRPRFWPAIIRANAIDIMVGISTVVFLQLSADNLWWQLTWVLLYILWLMFLKPATSIALVSVQAFAGQLYGLMALFMEWSSGPLLGLVFVTAVICYVSARHFFDSFDEPYSKMLSYLWAYFAAGLMWVLGHWLLFYGVVAQPTIVLSTVGYGLAVLYYFDHFGKLSNLLRRQILVIMMLVLLVLIIFSDWGDKVV